MSHQELLAAYLAHIHARAKRDGEVLPEALAALASREPEKCLELIVQVLAETLTPEEIRAVGNELLENLINESAGKISDRVSAELRKNRKFRQAFAFGNYASVDPAVLADWVKVFQDLGTTKAAERKSVWKRGA